MPQKFVKCSGYSIGVSAKDTDGNEIDILSIYMFAELYIQEAVASVPYFELYLAGGTLASIYNIWDFNLTLIKDDASFKTEDVPLGILTKTYKDSYIQVKGWLVKSSDFRIPRTQYLGSNVKDALVKLGIRKEENILIEPKSDQESKATWAPNINNEIFQINTTNLDEALALCQAVAATPYWCIGRNCINVGRNTEKTSFNNVLSGVNTVLVSSAPSVKPDEESEDVKNNIESPGKWFSTTWVNGSLDYHLADNHDLHKNAITNKKALTVGPRIIVEKTLPAESVNVVGTEYENDDKDAFPDISHWILTSVTYKYSLNSVESTLQYYGVSDAIEQQKHIDGDNG